MTAAEWGFSNDLNRHMAACAYRAEAIADGWEARPTYQHESIDDATTLTKDGFHMSILTRQRTGAKWRYEDSIHIWGPDGLAIEPPEKYSMGEIVTAARTCHYCKTENVDTKRVGFAGRCCASCYPEVVKKVEFPGWNN